MVLKGAKLLHLRLGEAEVWHGVTFTYRDPHWGTPEPLIHATRYEARGDGFRLRIEGSFPTTPVIALRLLIDGEGDGTLRVLGEAVPQGDIATNRLGLCLLHPMSLAGAAIEVEHDDGRISRSTFPSLIPPWPPFMLVRGMRHEHAPGLWARCRFAGDVFEFEDQRNNADASFKTYSRSNMAPRPYLLRAGVPVRQSVELAIEAPPSRIAPARRPQPVRLRPGARTGRLPAIGIEITPRDATTGAALSAALRDARPQLLHLALEEPQADPDWPGVAALLEAAGARLRLDLLLGDPGGAAARLGSLAEALRRGGIVPESLAVFPSLPSCLDAARRCFPEARIGGGTPHFFVQLSRLEGMGEPDFVTFTTCPIVHGTDDELVMLGLRSLRSMEATLRARGIRAPLRIGPSSIAARVSPFGPHPPTDGMRRIAMAAKDPRCRGLYGAAWMLGHVAELAAAGFEAVTVMSLAGPSGIVEDGTGRRRPTHALLRRLHGAPRLREIELSDPSRLAALMLLRGDAPELLLANLTGDAAEIALEDWPAASRLAVLDARAWPVLADAADPWVAARQPFAGASLTLPPYALASLLPP